MIKDCSKTSSLYFYWRDFNIIWVNVSGECNLLCVDVLPTTVLSLFNNNNNLTHGFLYTFRIRGPPTFSGIREITCLNAVFTLGRKMISLITYETCLARQCIAQIMIETCLFWSWSRQPHKIVLNMITLNVQNWAYCEKKCLVETLDDEELQQQQSAKCRKKRRERTPLQNWGNGLIQAHCIAMQNQNPQYRTKV